jgi:hypothetical protein
VLLARQSVPEIGKEISVERFLGSASRRRSEDMSTISDSPRHTADIIFSSIFVAPTNTSKPFNCKCRIKSGAVETKNLWCFSTNQENVLFHNSEPFSKELSSSNLGFLPGSNDFSTLHWMSNLGVLLSSQERLHESEVQWFAFNTLGDLKLDPEFSRFSSTRPTGRHLQLSERSRVTAAEHVRIASTRGFMGNQHTASRGPICTLPPGRIRIRRISVNFLAGLMLGNLRTVPYNRNSKFIEREGLFDDMIVRLAVKEGSQARLALFGLGGVGWACATIPEMGDLSNFTQEIANSPRIRL